MTFKRNLFGQLLNFWKKGYLYIFIASLIYLIWYLSGNVGILDWAKEISYFEYFKTSFNDYNSLPYFWWNILDEVAWRPPIPGTSALVANPETALFSPFMPLLYFFEPQTFMKLYIIIQFIIGVVGLFLLKNKLRWNNSQFRIFTILFLFSPIIMQHIAVAYFTWYNFYLFPWLVLFIAEKNHIKSIVGISAALGLIVLQGGIYIVQYLGLFYVLYEVFHIILEKDWKRIIRLIFIPIIAVLLSWARLSTTATVYGEYIRPWVEIDGYNLPFFLFYALIPTITISPLNLIFHSDYLGWSLTPHDSGLFWGAALVMLIIVTLKYKNIVTHPNSQNQNGLNYNAVFISATFLFLISFYRIWFYIMKGVSAFDVPLLESIKNHGIRFVMGAFFAYAILFSNYSKSIWETLHNFAETKFWIIAKGISKVIFKGIVILLGVLISVATLFKGTITNKIYAIITVAYNDLGHQWLHNRMEGMKLNSLEFYFLRFDVIYNSIQKWMIVIFVFFILLLIISYIIRSNRKHYTKLLHEFPFFKFEMLLAIPLILSTSMWANLAASVPYSDYEVLPLLAPKIVVQHFDNVDIEYPNIEVTPKQLSLTPISSKQVKGYLFTQIPSTDYKFFEIESKNATFFDKNGKLLLVPHDSNPIKMVFRTYKVLNALYITLISWFFVFCYIAINKLVFKKRKIL